jgi:hypothetical protein
MVPQTRGTIGICWGTMSIWIVNGDCIECRKIVVAIGPILTDHAHNIH